MSIVDSGLLWEPGSRPPYTLDESSWYTVRGPKPEWKIIVSDFGLACHVMRMLNRDAEQERQHALTTPLTKSALPRRVSRLLIAAGHKTIGDLVKQSPDALWRIKGIGRRGFVSIERLLIYTRVNPLDRWAEPARIPASSTRHAPGGTPGRTHPGSGRRRHGAGGTSARSNDTRAADSVPPRA
jgi:hypothetical protein